MNFVIETREYVQYTTIRMTMFFWETLGSKFYDKNIHSIFLPNKFYHLDKSHTTFENASK